MIENATNLTNTTSCVGGWKGFFVFFPDHWQELSALAAIILVVIGLILRKYLQKWQLEYPKQEAKRILGRRLEEFGSCWAGFKEKHKESESINLDFRNELFLCGNTLKNAIEKDEGLLPKTIVDEANNIADTFIDLANSLRSRIDRTGMATDAQKQQKYQEVLEEGDRIVRKAKELKEKLGADGNE